MTEAATAPITTIRAPIPHKMGLLWKPSTYKVLYGGRGGGKSWSIARVLLARALKKPLFILCTRELQVSIHDSVHRVLSNQIAALGFDKIIIGGKPFFDVQRNTIIGQNGSQFIFNGLRNNVSKIRSAEGIDIVWCEEAESISDDSWDTLLPTIRKDGSEIWISFNPYLATDPTYRRFVTDPPPDTLSAKVGWEDNPWFPERLKEKKDYLYKVDPDAAAWVYGGETRMLSDAQVLKGKVHVEPFEPGDDWDGPYQGADWGFAQDPTVLVREWVYGNDLYLEREAYGVGVEITETPELFRSVEDSEKYVTRADSARPETISHVRQNGFPRLIAAEKGTGSVEDGVAHLRGYERIVIHPRCVHAIEESRLWSYKKDAKSGDILPILVDKHNHIWDAARYALEPLIKRRAMVYGYKPTGRPTRKGTL